MWESITCTIYTYRNILSSQNNRDQDFRYAERTIQTTALWLIVWACCHHPSTSLTYLSSGELSPAFLSFHQWKHLQNVNILPGGVKNERNLRKIFGGLWYWCESRQRERGLWDRREDGSTYDMPPSFFSPKRTWFMRFQIDGWVSVNVRHQGWSENSFAKVVVSND